MLAAFFASGGLNAGTPLAIASTPGQGDRPAGERAEEQEEAERLGPRSAPASRLGRDRRRAAVDDADRADDDDEQRQAGEQVGRDGEDVARLAQAAKVADRDED